MPMATRRTFVKQSALAAGAAALVRPDHAGAAATPALVGIQIGAVSFVDEGTGRAIESVQEMGGVNTLFVAACTDGRRIPSCIAARASRPRRPPTTRATTCWPT